MSEPATETSDKLREFMSLPPARRDEFLWFKEREVRNLLVDSKIVSKVEKLTDTMNGTPEQAGLLVRFNELEHVVKKLVKSNDRLQKAMYVCLGIWIAAKFYFEYIAPHK